MDVLRRLGADKRPSTTPSNQENSQFLSIPGEIRGIIYNLLLGHRFVDLYLTEFNWRRKTRGPLACQCLNLDQTQRLPDHHPKIPERNAKHPPDFVFPPVKRRPYFQWPHKATFELAPAFILTCRKVFLESGHLLYSANVFQITDPNVLFSLPKRLDSSSLKNIHSIHMHYTARGSWNPAYQACDKKVIQAWSNIWRDLSMLQGLDELFFRLWDPYVLIHTEEFRISHFNAEHLLEPLQQVTKPTSFKFMLALPERLDPSALSVSGTFCEVIKTTNLHQEAAFGADTWLKKPEHQQILIADEGQKILDEALGQPVRRTIVSRAFY